MGVQYRTAIDLERATDQSLRKSNKAQNINLDLIKNTDNVNLDISVCIQAREAIHRFHLQMML